MLRQILVGVAASVCSISPIHALLTVTGSLGGARRVCNLNVTWITSPDCRHDCDSVVPNGRAFCRGARLVIGLRESSRPHLKALISFISPL